MKQIQVQNSSAQAALVKTTNTLRCSDFNYVSHSFEIPLISIKHFQASNLHKSYYNGEQDKLGSSTSSSFRRQLTSVQDRKISNIYSRYTDYQYLDSKSKRDERNDKSMSKTSLNIDESNNFSQVKDSVQSPLTQSIHQSKYQTPQKGQSSYHSRSYTQSFNDQLIQQSDKKVENESPLGDSKQQINQKYLRYTTDHVRYCTPFKGESTSKSDKQQKINFYMLNIKEEVLYLSQKISKQELKKLQDSPTKENEQYNTEERSQNNALQSYSGFISRNQNNYYKRSAPFESPVSDEKNLLKESYSKVLNYQTSSAYSKESNLQSSVKSYRATQSEKKNFQEEIEQYKKELKEYQSQLSSYQEQLRNSLNKNKIELFDGQASIRDSQISTSISQYSKASFLDLKYSTQCNKYQIESETPKTSQKQEYEDYKGTPNRLQQSATFTKPVEKIQKSSMSIFHSISIDPESLEDKPQKMLEAINIENSVIMTSDHNLENQCKKDMDDIQERKIIKIKKVESFIESDLLESQTLPKEETQNINQENNFITSKILNNGETDNKKSQRSLSVSYKEASNQESQITNNMNEKKYDYRTRSNSSYYIERNTPLQSSSVYSKNNDYQENTQKEDSVVIINNKNCSNQQLTNFQKIDSVGSESFGCYQKQQPIIKNTNQYISEESSTKQKPDGTIIQRSNLQVNKQDNSDSIIKIQYDKLKEIENRYKRVEEISKKYSHLYRSKLLQPTPNSQPIESKLTQDLSASVPPTNSTEYQSEQQPNTSFTNLLEKTSNNTDKEMTSVFMFPNLRDSTVVINKDSNALSAPLPINNRLQVGEDFFTQKTPRFQTMDGEEYFKTAEQILQLSRQCANKLDQSLCLTDRETLQNLSQVDMDCDMKNEMLKSPSVTAL